MNVKMSNNNNNNNNDNIEGKMKEKKRSNSGGGGGLKFIGLCFSSNEPRIQPQHQHQPYQQYQNYHHHHHYQQHQQWPNHHVPRGGNGRSPVANHPTGGNVRLSPVAHQPMGGGGRLSPAPPPPPIAHQPMGGGGLLSPAPPPPPVAHQPMGVGRRLSPAPPPPSPPMGKESSKVEPRRSKSPKFFPSLKDVIELRQNPGYSNVDIFTFEEMKLATRHFRPDLILGEGGFGVVYRGLIDDEVRPGYKTVDVAIKQLNPNGFQGDREWLTEVRYLGQLSHPNLVKLIGYCCEDEHRLLVYEYMASGCLEKHLFRRMSATLTWLRRIKIALDAAKGLAYLHGLEQSIIYRDFKTSNILLDSNFNAKISDFGLAKEGPMGDQTHVSTRVMGTYGYAAPEYIMTGRLTARSDVYGYGVVLLEMLIGRRTLDKSRPSREHNLVDWCRPLLNNNKKLLRIVDGRIDGQYSVKEMMRVANLGYQCLSQNPKGRPLMSQVVEVLEAVYEEERNRKMTLLPQYGGGVTLYEAPREKPDSQSPMRSRNPSPGPSPRQDRNTPTSDDERVAAARRRRREGRSRSEPPNEYGIVCRSPEINY